MTRAQVERLEQEAAEAMDMVTAAICRVALGRDHAEVQLDAEERARVDSMTEAEAWAECERVIAAALAMDDSR